MSEQVSAIEVEALIRSADPLAVLDVREHGLYGEGHLLFASNCPYSVLELRVAALVPNHGANLVIYDHGDGVAERAARALEQLGYRRVLVLKGGIQAWLDAGLGVFKGVNVPSKVLGELVEHAMHTASITPEQLIDLQASGRPFLLVDGRPTAEYEKMTVPGARSLPNGELLYRWNALGLDPELLVVVHCAGRTRGLIGAQSLLNAGVPNPVVALQNGTQGWAIAGRTLARHNTVEALPEMTEAQLDQGKAWSEKLISDYEIETLEASDLAAWRLANPSAYMFDVRSRAEFEAANIPGTRHAPTVQLVQATDEYVAQRRATILLVDDNRVRAASSGMWLTQLGHRPIVMKNAESLMQAPRQEPRVAATSVLRSISAADLMGRSGNEVIVDIRSSMAFRQGHLPGSVWSTRSRIGAAVPSGCQIVTFVADDPEMAEFCASELRHGRAIECRLLEGGLTAWQAVSGVVEQSPDCPSDAEAIDFVFFVHDRHHGNLDAARRYLEWETGLVAQLSAAERAEFHVRMKHHE